MAIVLTACHSYKVDSSRPNSLIGAWKQPNVNLIFKNNSNYHYEYVDAGYKYEQSGKYRYFSDRDSLVVAPKKVTVVLNGDTLNTEKEPIEIFARRK